MARFLPLFAVFVLVALALAAGAYPSKPHGFVQVPVDGHVDFLGEFAVKRFDEQNNDSLQFIQVLYAEVLDRGTEHYTYRLIIKVYEEYGVKVYKGEVLQDKGAPEEPPVLNLGYFMPL